MINNAKRSIVQPELLVTQDLLSPLHQLPVQPLDNLPYLRHQTHPLSMRLHLLHLVIQHACNPVVFVGIRLLEQQRLAALHHKLLLYAQPVAQIVRRRPQLLKILKHDHLAEFIVNGSNDMHVVAERLLAFGEVDAVELIGLQQHVEDEYFDEDHQT